MKNPSTLKDVLYNASDDCVRDEFDQFYGKGIVVGVVSTLMAEGRTFEQAIKVLREYMPERFSKDVVPENWHDEMFAKPVKRPDRGDLPVIWEMALATAEKCIAEKSLYVVIVDADSWPGFRLETANKCRPNSTYRFDDFTAFDLASNVLYKLEWAVWIDVKADAIDKFLFEKGDLK